MSEPRPARKKKAHLDRGEVIMSRRCEVTGRSPGHGRTVSHSQVRTPRRFEVNVQDRRYWLPSERRWIRLRLSTKAIKTVDRDGIESVVARMRVTGRKV